MRVSTRWQNHDGERPACRQKPSTFVDPAEDSTRKPPRKGFRRKSPSSGPRLATHNARRINRRFLSPGCSRRCRGVKTVLLTLLILFAAFHLACVIEAPPPGSAGLASSQHSEASHRAEAADGWRRTIDGWERMSEWSTSAPSPETPAGFASVLHPLFLAIFQGLVSCGALLWFEPASCRQGKTRRISCTKRHTTRH
jgi:hypothetical protein